MFSNIKIVVKKLMLSIILLMPLVTLFAQEEEKDKSEFWNKVSIGGGLGLNVGNGIFSASVSPSAVYNFNEYFSAGPGLHYSYQSGRNFNTSLYGASLIGLANPLPQLQLSAEIEQLKYNINRDVQIQNTDGSISTVEATSDGWNTALFIGAGYRVGPASIGVRYNVLFQEDDDIYATAFAPFVRVYF
ncbi:hypothetical protein [Patiriisocius marinus]|nr:hypothetical protein [Patiriisocius marinus]